MAAVALASLERVQPNGPCYIAGYSLGGLVAFELARKFERAGRAVPFVGLIDTPYDSRYWPNRAKLHTKLKQLFARFGQIGKAPAGAPPARMGAEVGNLARRISARLRPPQSSPPMPMNADLTPRERCRAALPLYAPGQYSGEVKLFKSVPGGSWYYDLTVLWRKHVKRLDVKSISSDHFELLRVGGLAFSHLTAAINDDLEKADRRSA
jgi:thioesterase domain-containing protein